MHILPSFQVGGGAGWEEIAITCYIVVSVLWNIWPLITQS